MWCVKTYIVPSVVRNFVVTLNVEEFYANKMQNCVKGVSNIIVNRRSIANINVRKRISDF